MGRYSHDTSASSLALEPSQPSHLLNLFHPPNLASTGTYAQDGGPFYQQPTSSIFPGLDVRARLPSRYVSALPFIAPSTRDALAAPNDSKGLTFASTTSSSVGMAHTHTHRNAPLPHPGPHISAREQYSPGTPLFGREHLSRSPSYSGSAVRRNRLSPTPNVNSFAASASRMDSNPYPNRPLPNTIPPLLPIQMFGSLNYMDASLTPVKVDIAGTIDKGFFIASDGEWTCYRRNYFTCVCSYSLSPQFSELSLQFTPLNSVQPLQAYGFAMSIAAVVADNDSHGIDLVQHTPKRDKGPTGKPEKIPLGPKPGHAGHHPLGVYGDGSTVPSSRMFSDGFGGPQGNGQAIATEHTFERIQFKQATQNNGKRRAAQQYYHLVIELWADTGNQIAERYVKVASRKSAKMIVRGRSPGHYQNDKRGSQSSGPGGSAGNLGSYTGLNSINDFAPGTILSTGPGYGGGFDGRGTIYGSGRHHDIPAEVMIPPEDEKDIENAKGYRYYPGSIYPDQSEHVDMFPQRNEIESQSSHMSNELDTKPRMGESYEMGGMPRHFRPPPLMSTQRRCGPFEGKADTNGYYPTMLATPGGHTTIS